MHGGTQNLDGFGGVRRFGSGTPSVPSDISGLLFWFKTPISGATNNVAITTWPDSSSAGRNATPNGTGLTYLTNVINGLAVVRDNNDYATFTSANLGTAHSVFIVIRPVLGFNDGVFVGGSAAGRYTPYIDSTNIYYRALSTEAFVTVTHGGVVQNTSYLFEIIRNDTSVSFYKNGSQLSTTQTLGANTALTVTQIGGAGGGFNPSDYQIAEIFVFDTALSTANRQAMESYISSRFAFF